ncbi:MAG: VCBS repeat-containing protein [Leptospirales bacterium]|nr:VCBS repeat-containing protein [Leptospirales bacterium]
MNKIFAKILGFLFILALTLTFISCSSSNSSNSGEEPWKPYEPGRYEDLPDDPQLNLLSGLGLFPSVKDPVDPLGNPLREDYQPLKNLTTRGASEIFTMGVAFNQSGIIAANASRNNYYLTDVGFDTSNLSIVGTAVITESKIDLADQPNKSLAVDIDNDGIEEVVLAVANRSNPGFTEIYVGTFTNNGSWNVSWDFQDQVAYIPGNNNNRKLEDVTISIEDGVRRYIAFMDIVAADLDGDGYKDVIITVGNSLTVFKNNGGTGLTKAAEWYEPNPGTIFLRIAAGDFDMDGKDELVVAGNYNNGSNAYYSILKGMNLESIADGYIGNPALYRAEVVTGDFDDDGLIDIAFGGITRSDRSPLNLVILKTGMKNEGGVSKATFTRLNNYTEITDRDYQLLEAMAAGNPFFGEGTWVWMAGWFFRVEGNSIIRNGGGGLGGGDYGGRVRMAAMTDLTGEGQDELVVITGDELAYTFVLFQYPPGMDRTHYNEVSRRTAAFTQSCPFPSLCLPNVTNDDSFVLKFLEHRVEFTDPVVVAVVASPPYVDGINDDGDGYTTFGKSKGKATEHSTAHGFSVEGAIGASVEQAIPIIGTKVVEIEALFVASTLLQYGYAKSFEVTESWGYETKTGTDMVVFTAIPFDVYYYEILQAPNDAPKAQQKGELTLISIPRKPLGPVPMPLEEFNKRNSAYKISTGNKGDVLQHKLGVPGSYPTWADVSEIKKTVGSKGLFTSKDNQQTVGMGGASSYISVEKMESDSHSFNDSWSCGYKSSVTAGGIKVEAEIRYEGGYSYTSTVSKSTFIEGSVPSLSPYAWDANYFAWGLMCYPYTNASTGQEFPVVTYCVEPH